MHTCEHSWPHPLSSCCARPCARWGWDSGPAFRGRCPRARPCSAASAGPTAWTPPSRRGRGLHKRTSCSSRSAASTPVSLCHAPSTGAQPRPLHWAQPHTLHGCPATPPSHALHLFSRGIVSSVTASPALATPRACPGSYLGRRRLFPSPSQYVPSPDWLLVSRLPRCPHAPLVPDWSAPPPPPPPQGPYLGPAWRSLCRAARTPSASCAGAS